MADLPPIKDANTENNPVSTDMPLPIGDFESLSPGSKDVMIGSSVLLVLAVIFIFIRSGYVNYLVSSLKRSPNNAGLAGWGLFGFLLFGSAIGCLAIISKSYLTLAAIIPLASLSLICLIICLVVSTKKR